MQVLGYTRCTAAVKLAIRKLRSKDCQGNSPIADEKDIHCGSGDGRYALIPSISELVLVS